MRESMKFNSNRAAERLWDQGAGSRARQLTDDRQRTIWEVNWANG